MTSVWTVTILYGTGYSEACCSKNYTFQTECDALKGIEVIKEQARCYFKKAIILETVVVGV